MPLWRTLVTLRPLPVLDDPHGQPLVDQPQDPLVRDPVPEKPPKPSMIKLAETVPDTIRTSMNRSPLLVTLGRFEAERLAGLARR
jgi:hypothetical protein